MHLFNMAMTVCEAVSITLCDGDKAMNRAKSQSSWNQHFIEGNRDGQVRKQHVLGRKLEASLLLQNYLVPDLEICIREEAVS